MRSEELSATKNKMIFIERDTPYSKEEVAQKMAMLRSAIEKGDTHSVLHAIRATVPTYRAPEEINRCAEESQEMQDAFCEEAAV